MVKNERSSDLNFWASSPKQTSFAKWLCDGVDKGEAWCCWQYAIRLKERSTERSCLRMALKLLERAAKTGFAPAEFSLGVMYSLGQAVRVNKKTALSWFKRSASHGFPTAAYNVGNYLENGIGCIANRGRAAQWYRIAANMGDSDAEVSLGNLCADIVRETGRSDYEDYALYWYTEAANHGNLDGLYNLALCYHFGSGVRKNERRYRKLLSRAAGLGHSKAKNMLLKKRKCPDPILGTTRFYKLSGE